MTDPQKALEDAGYEKVCVARHILKTKTPYYSGTAYSLVPIAVPGLQTICTTDRLVMGFDPAWFVSLTDEEAAAAVWHETQHVIGEHFERGVELPDKEMANIAGDLAINCSAKHIGYTLPKGSYYPSEYNLPDDLSMEEYYNIMQGQPQQKKPQGGGKKKGKAVGATAPGGTPSGGGGPPPQLTGTGVCAGKCGSIAGNGDPDIEDKINAAAEKESPGCSKSQAEVRAVVKQAAREILDHVAAHGRGSIPAHLIERAKFTLKPPKVPWRTKLRRVLRRCTGRIVAGGADYSKARPSKRSYCRGIIVPGLIKRQACVAFVRDTSGSMGVPQLQDAQNESVGVMKALGLDTVWFLDADADVGMAKIVRVQDIPKLPITGRGGTDFGPALEAIKRLRPRPKLVMYFTDGDGAAPAVAPKGIDVIWVVVRSYYNKPPADWGHTIFVDDGPDGRPQEDEEFD